MNGQFEFMLHRSNLCGYSRRKVHCSGGVKRREEEEFNNFEQQSQFSLRSSCGEIFEGNDEKRCKQLEVITSVCEVSSFGLHILK